VRSGRMAIAIRIDPRGHAAHPRIARHGVAGIRNRAQGSRPSRTPPFRIAYLETVTKITIIAIRGAATGSSAIILATIIGSGVLIVTLLRRFGDSVAATHRNAKPRRSTHSVAPVAKHA
jgi:hypothetical protein